MSRHLKHMGRVIATGKKCVVAYRTLPGDANYCLIVPTENLPDNYHNAIINLVESNAGQTANEFAEAMARTQFSDGSIMLAALHVQGRLVKAKTNEIEMLPGDGQRIVLSELNQLIAEQKGVAVDDLAIKSGPSDSVEKSKILPAEPVPASEPVNTNVNSENYMSPIEKAAKLRAQAEALLQQANELDPIAGTDAIPVIKNEQVVETVAKPAEDTKKIATPVAKTAASTKKAPPNKIKSNTYNNKKA